MKKVGFLSFGHWADRQGYQASTASDTLLHSIDLAIAAEGMGLDGANAIMNSGFLKIIALFAMLLALTPMLGQAQLLGEHSAKKLSDIEKFAERNGLTIVGKSQVFDEIVVDYKGPAEKGLPAPDITYRFYQKDSTLFDLQVVLRSTYNSGDSKHNELKDKYLIRFNSIYRDMSSHLGAGKLSESKDKLSFLYQWNRDNKVAYLTFSEEPVGTYSIKAIIEYGKAPFIISAEESIKKQAPINPNLHVLAEDYIDLILNSNFDKAKTYLTDSLHQRTEDYLETIVRIKTYFEANRRPGMFFKNYSRQTGTNQSERIGLTYKFSVDEKNRVTITFIEEKICRIQFVQ